MAEHEFISLGAIIIFLMIMLYMIMGTCIEKYHCKFGHEAAYTIVIGMAVSLVLAETRSESEIQALSFSDNTFFYVCLPPIVFASGFNMQRG